LPDTYSVRNGLQQGDLSLILHSELDHYITKVKRTRMDRKWMGNISFQSMLRMIIYWAIS